MGRLVWLILIAAPVLLMSFINVAECWQEVIAAQVNEVIHVGGKVLCQDCTQGWNEWVNGDNPIKGCKVSVTCMDDRKRIVYYGSDETDETGEFELIISKYTHGKEIKPNRCFMRLVSSPDPYCNIPTDFAGGKTGVKLNRPTMVYRDIIKHVLGPFYYTTPMCDEPYPSIDHSYGENNNY